MLSKRRKIYPEIARLIDFLVAWGLLLGLLSILMDSKMLADFAFNKVKNVYELIAPSLGYKIIKSLEILFIISAGFLSYWTEGRFYPNRYIKIIFAILLFWMTGHAITTFIGGFTNTELIGSKGPVVWWSMLLIFAGLSDKRWQRIIYPIIRIIVIVGAIEMVLRIFNLTVLFDRVDAQRNLRFSIRLMLWSAPLIFLVPTKNEIVKILSVMLLSLISLAALVTVTRSWLIICLIYMLAWIFCISRKVKRPQAKITIIVSIVVIILPAVFLLMYSLFETQIQNGGTLLSARIAIDTRTWQLEQFFSNVPLVDLMVGTGPRGTWQWESRAYGYVDGVYFFLLFVGGIPLLASYFYVVIYPAIRCFFLSGFSLYGSKDFACIFMVIVWGIVMTGIGTYTTPELRINHYLVLLCAGKCWSNLYFLKASQARNRKSKIYPKLNTYRQKANYI